MFSAGLFTNPSGQTIQLSGYAVVFCVTRITESFDDLSVSCAFYRSCAKYRCLTTCGLNLQLQPLKVLIGLFISGKHVNGVLNGYGSKLLQFAPDANSQVRRPRR